MHKKKAKLNRINKAKFLNGEKFTVGICNNVVFEYEDASTDENPGIPGSIVEHHLSLDGKPLFHQHEANVSKIGNTTARAYTFVLGERVGIVIRFHELVFPSIPE